MQFLAIDIGSTTIKAAMLDLERSAVGPVTRIACPDPVVNLPPKHFELDGEQVVAAVQSLADSLIAQTPACQGIVSCSQMAGVILANAKGEPLTNYLSWRDQRALEPHPQHSETYYDVFRQRLPEFGMQQLGRECKLGASPSLLFWLKENDRLPVDAIPLTLGDFIWMRLAGAEPITEATNALGAMHLESGQWHHEVFECLGLDDLAWPRICSPFEVIGEYRSGGRAIPCYAAVGDHQCALAGTRLAPGELSVNISTGSQVSMLASEFTMGDYQVRPYFEGRYLNTLTHLPAGRSLNVLVRLLEELAASQGRKLDNPWPYIAQAVSESAPSRLEVDLGFFEGPMGSDGAIRNISVDNLTMGSLFRAAFQNMANNYRICADRLSREQTFQLLVLSGGLVQQDVLRNLILGRFACPHRVCTTSEETLTGLLALAYVAGGQCDSLSTAYGLLRNL